MSALLLPVVAGGLAVWLILALRKRYGRGNNHDAGGSAGDSSYSHASDSGDCDSGDGGGGDGGGD